jgi:hypothetical protein
MRNLNKIAILIIALLSNACVQKTYKQTVVFTIDVSNVKNIKTVGLRGEGSPLSWDKDLEMKPLKKDSLYTITLSAETGYKFVEVKFTVNGEFELQNKPNRRVVFGESGTTVYNSKFDIENKK